MGEEKISYEKPLEDYDVDALSQLAKHINDLPEFVMPNEDRIKWLNKLEKQKNSILDKVEKQHSKYSRKEKVQKWLDYQKTLEHHESNVIEGNNVRDIYDPSAFGIMSIDEFYMRHRVEIEKFIDKLFFIAPLTKEQLELLVLNEEKIYFG